MFDFRYHALSLVAVFLALAIGLLLGVAIGDQGARLERRAGPCATRCATTCARPTRARADLRRELASATTSSGQALSRCWSADRLPGQRSGSIGLRRPARARVGRVRDALGPTGGAPRRGRVDRASRSTSRLARRPEGHALRDAAPPTPDARTPSARRIGRQLGDAAATLLKRVRRTLLLARSSGTSTALDGVIVVRARPRDSSGDGRGQRADAFEDGLGRRPAATRRAGGRRRADRHRPLADPLVQGPRTVERRRPRHARPGKPRSSSRLLGAERRRYGVEGQRARPLLPPDGSRPPARPTRRCVACSSVLARSSLAAASASRRPLLRALRETPASCAENYRGAGPAVPGGRGDRRRRALLAAGAAGPARRAGATPTTSCAPELRDRRRLRPRRRPPRADRRRARGRAARLARPRARRCCAASFSTGALKAAGSLGLALYVLSRPRLSATRRVPARRRACSCSPPTSSTCSTCGPGRSVKAFAAARRGARRSGAWDARPAVGARPVRRARARRRRSTTCASGRCSATPART